MTPEQLTGNDLRDAVFEIVSRELGPAALVRYIAENFSQPGDYTSERQGKPQGNIEEIVAAINARKARPAGSGP